MISKVYWTEEYPLGKTYNVSKNLPDKVDFLIIGGGYTGLTAARVLAKTESSVAVFDEKKSVGGRVLAMEEWLLQA